MQSESLSWVNINSNIIKDSVVCQLGANLHGIIFQNLFILTD
jgi:hypothetical protein